VVRAVWFETDEIVENVLNGMKLEGIYMLGDEDLANR
jgi:hypothetical protein